jgi:hypothetical protein
MAARRVGAAFVLLTMLSSPLVAQTVSGDPRTLDERLFYFLEYRADALVRAAAGTASAEARASELRARLDRLPDILNVNLRSFTYYALPPSTLTDSFKEFLQSADKARVDQQIGSTSKAVKTGVAALVGFALETGAVSQAVDQNVATLRANAEGLARFLSNQDVFATCPDDDQACNAWSALKNLELSASFNVSDSDTTSLTGTPLGATTPVNLSSTLTRHQFASATARYAVMNRDCARSDISSSGWPGSNRIARSCRPKAKPCWIASQRSRTSCAIPANTRRGWIGRRARSGRSRPTTRFRAIGGQRHCSCSSTTCWPA